MRFRSSSQREGASGDEALSEKAWWLCNEVEVEEL